MQSINGRRWATILALALLLAGCGGESAAYTSAPAATAGSAASQPSAAATAAPAGGPAGSTVQIVSDPSRKIIKDATFILEVQNVAIALTQIGNIAAQAGGYVLETRTEGGQSRPAGFVKIAVPVDQFEAALQRVRESAATIISEQASGQDVTQEFVDTQSQLANLEATQARIREFLNQAKTVEESLDVNAQLTEIEGQISQLKGRSQFLAGRAAYSTITVQLQQQPGPPTPMPAPLADTEPDWSAGATVESARTVLVAIARVIATAAIWLAIVVGPFAAPALLIWLALRVFRRRSSARSPGAPPAAE